jgi:hypothetical protein
LFDTATCFTSKRTMNTARPITTTFTTPDQRAQLLEQVPNMPLHPFITPIITS